MRYAQNGLIVFLIFYTNCSCNSYPLEITLTTEDVHTSSRTVPDRPNTFRSVIIVGSDVASLLSEGFCGVYLYITFDKPRFAQHAAARKQSESSYRPPYTYSKQNSFLKIILMSDQLQRHVFIIKTTLYSHSQDILLEHVVYRIRS